MCRLIMFLSNKTFFGFCLLCFPKLVNIKILFFMYVRCCLHRLVLCRDSQINFVRNLKPIKNRVYFQIWNIIFSQDLTCCFLWIYKSIHVLSHCSGLAYIMTSIYSWNVIWNYFEEKKIDESGLLNMFWTLKKRDFLSCLRNFCCIRYICTLEIGLFFVDVQLS